MPQPCRNVLYYERCCHRGTNSSGFVLGSVAWTVCNAVVGFIATLRHSLAATATATTTHLFKNSTLEEVWSRLVAVIAARIAVYVCVLLCVCMRVYVCVYGRRIHINIIKECKQLMCTYTYVHTCIRYTFAARSHNERSVYKSYTYTHRSRVYGVRAHNTRFAAHTGLCTHAHTQTRRLFTYIHRIHVHI